MTLAEATTTPIEHPQRWFNSEKYILPTDNEEARRLQLQHDLLREMFEDRVVCCPLKLNSGDVVLDVGTGKAAWAIDFLSSYPNTSRCKLIGIDVSDLLFPENPHPSMTFEIQNVLALPAEWTGRFAFVHQRLLMAALQKDEWKRAIQEVHRVTKNGGWAQFCESDSVSFRDGIGPVYARFMELYDRLWEAKGLDSACASNVGPIMRQVGFADVTTERRSAHVGKWNGDIGAKHLENLMGIYRGFKTPILKLGGLGIVEDEAQYDQLMEDLELEWGKPGAVYGYNIITGRKAVD